MARPTGLTVRGSRAVAIVAVSALAGCNGGTVDRHALTKDASTLDSIACEGALLAHDVARGRWSAVIRIEGKLRRGRPPG